MYGEGRGPVYDGTSLRRYANVFDGLAQLAADVLGDNARVAGEMPFNELVDPSRLSIGGRRP